MAESTSRATGGNANININGDGNKADNALQAIMSFAIDIPRVVRANGTLWGISVLAIVCVSAAIVNWNLSSKIDEIRESQERIEKSLINMHDKYNRMTRYIRTNDINAFSKTKIEED